MNLSSKLSEPLLSRPQSKFIHPRRSLKHIESKESMFDIEGFSEHVKSD
jgi:hypothetical protein